MEEGGEGAGLVCDGGGKAEGSLAGAALLLHCAGGLVGGLGKPVHAWLSVSMPLREMKQACMNCTGSENDWCDIVAATCSTTKVNVHELATDDQNQYS